MAEGRRPKELDTCGRFRTTEDELVDAIRSANNRRTSRARRGSS
jgi:hypothetical protein